jgi:peroxiredoxin
MIQLVPAALLSVALAPIAAEPGTVLDEAAAAMAALRSASYEGRLEMTAAATQRAVTGLVIMERNSPGVAGFLGGKVVVRGEVAGGSAGPEKFELAFDGKTVTRYQAKNGSLLQADPGHGGEALLQGPYGGLILREMLESAPFAADADATLAHLGATVIDGRPAEVVEVTPAGGGTVSRWSIDVVDRLPRRVERVVRSSSGRDVQWVLTLGSLKADVPIEPATFAVSAAGARLQVMGQNLPKTLTVGTEAPDWTLKDAEGREHKLSDYKGRIVVLDFWATWCPHCRNAMPSMQKLHDTYKERGVAIFGVNCREKGPVDAGAFVREAGYNYTVLVDSGEVAVKYRVKGIPAFFVIGPDGKILHMDSGFNAAKEAAIVALIERQLAGQG